MYTIIINPKLFEIYKVKEENGKPEYELEIKKKSPQEVDVYDVIELEEIKDIDFDKILPMIYSTDKETQTMALDMLKTQDGTHDQDLEDM